MSETTTGTAAPAATAAPGAAAAVAATTTPAATPAPATTLPALGTPAIGDAPTPPVESKPDVSTSAASNEAAKSDTPPITPVEYAEFTLPDGIAKDGALLDVFRTEAGKLGLPQEQAQALVTAVGERMAADATKAAEAIWQTWVDTNDKWAAEIKADKDIGGAKFDGMKVTVAKLFDDYVGHSNTPERKALNEALLLTGAGNNPAIVRAIAKIAAAHTEGSFVTGSPARGPVDRAALLYPTMGQPNGAARG